MHTGLFRVFYFHQQPRYIQKTKKNILKIYNVAFRDIAKKRKKIFLKFCNVALCATKNRCIPYASSCNSFCEK
ncbi:hypothetical protein PUN28_020722 [Cardiocondyla obscurior]|uniref:Uncharacterized protein n=1 Tax=Cardiocondyla obscurior TaxID=286306 RepID=A0AAW2E522_9HYME